MRSELPSLNSSLDETVLSPRRLDGMTTGGTISDAPPGNATGSSLQGPDGSVQYLHSPTSDASVDRYAEAEKLGFHTRAAASESSKPVSNGFQFGDIPGEFDWNTWNFDGLEPAFSFDQDGQGR